MCSSDLEALALAGENAAGLELTERVKLLKSDWFSALPDGARFDLIVANPPYLSAVEATETAPEVGGFEPLSALTPTGGLSGMEDLRTIISGAAEYLAPGGFLALETGPEQHPELLTLLTAAGFTRCVSEADLTGRSRFLFASI